MKRTACLFPAAVRALAALAVLLAWQVNAPPAMAVPAARPRYGGTLRIEIAARVATIDPRQPPANSRSVVATERLAALVFDRLVRLDESGTPQSALAESWEHDAEWRHWEFFLRPGLAFSDGTLCTPEEVARALREVLPPAMHVAAAGNSVSIAVERGVPDLLLQLATGRAFIFHAGNGGKLYGTGPFLLVDAAGSLNGAQAVFIANTSCWSGRPFLDRVEVRMGVDTNQQAVAVATGQSDVVEIAASQANRSMQRGVRTVASELLDLLAIRIEPARALLRDSRVAAALSLSMPLAMSLAIDRNSIADVILQRQALPAAGLLPNWLSGYAFLFPTAVDIPRANSLLSVTPREVFRGAVLTLVYDAADADLRLVAERVAVNLRDVGIVVKTAGQPPGNPVNGAAPDMILTRLRVTGAAGDTALAGLQKFGPVAPPEPEKAGRAYAAERELLQSLHMIPLVHVSEIYGLSAQVRDWMPLRSGDWRLAEVWLSPVVTGKVR